MKKWLLIVVAVILAFVGYSMWASDQEAREILAGFTRAGVVRAYSCGDRTTPSITVNSDWATLRAQTQTPECSTRSRWCVQRPLTLR